MSEIKNTSLSRPDIARKISSFLTAPWQFKTLWHNLLPNSFAVKILDQMSCGGVLLLDRSLQPVYSNHTCEQLLDNVHAHWFASLNKTDYRQLLDGLHLCLTNNTNFTAECRVQQVDRGATATRWLRCVAKPFYAADNGFRGCLCTFTDITDQRQTNQNLLQLSLYDPLTKLPNRSLLMQTLKGALQPGNITDLAIVFIDLDGFKLINDTLGREQGNILIKEVSTRLNCCVESTDLLARLGSDEFTAIVEHNNAPQRAAEIARQVISVLEQPFHIEQEDVCITASVGIAFAKPGLTAERLLQQADVAMYNAKKVKGNAVKYHSHKLTAQNRAKLLVGTNLHRALERNEFKTFYQPQLEIISNTICGSEALLRWNNPELGTISPSIFIPMLEDRGLINQVGEWVLAQACNDQARWHRQYPQNKTTVSVNVSSLQLHDRHFLSKLKKILDTSGLEPHYLVLELTETILLDEFVSECRVLHEISALGVKIALDDFGTGYGSFSYLKKHPIDHIKIDRSFVDKLFCCEENRAITTSIIELSHRLGKTVIAEGVDSQDELDFLMLRGCDIYQGYFSSKAIPSTEFEDRFLLSDQPCAV